MVFWYGYLATWNGCEGQSSILGYVPEHMHLETWDAHPANSPRCGYLLHKLPSFLQVQGWTNKEEFLGVYQSLGLCNELPQTQGFKQ